METRTKCAMPYSVWSKKLALKVSTWYQIYAKYNKDALMVSGLNEFLILNKFNSFMVD